MTEEMGLILNIKAKLDSASANKIQRDLEKTLGVKTKAVDGKAEGRGFAEQIQKPLQSFARGDFLGGIKGFLKGGIVGGPKAGGGGGGIFGAGILGGLTGGLVVGLLDGIKTAVIKTFELFQQASPMFKRSLRMIHIAVLSIVRPIGDIFGRIMYPIARFFMLWGRAIMKTYREKYAEYIAQGMSPIEASIKAGVEAFAEGIVGLFSGEIAGYNFGPPIQTIIGSLVSELIKVITNPETMVPLLGIGALVVGAVGVALAGAAATFLLAMQTVAWAISGAAGLGLTGAAGTFLAAMGTVAATLGTVLSTAIIAAPFAAVFLGAAALMGYLLNDYVTEAFGKLTQGEGYGEPGYLPVPFTGIPQYPDWGQPWPPQFQHGGIVTKPTYGLIGEAGPEAIVPLSGPNAKKFGGSVVNITITGNTIAKEVDMDRAMQRAMDDYIRTFERSR